MYCVLDIETPRQDINGFQGNYWEQDITAVALKHASDKQCLLFYKKSLEWQELKWVKVIVGHHITYDLLFLWKFPEFQDWLLNGGQIWDTQYAEYTLTGQLSKFSSLRDIAVGVYGCKEREKKMEMYWDQKIDTPNIPKEIVLEDVENDVLDTEAVYIQQLKKAEEQGQLNLIKLEMDAILATTEMKYNGMKVDKTLLESNRNALIDQLTEAEKTTYNLVKRYWK